MSIKLYIKYAGIFLSAITISGVTSFCVVKKLTNTSSQNTSPTTVTQDFSVDDSTKEVSVEDEINSYISKHINQPFPNLLFTNEDGTVSNPIPNGKPFLIHFTDTSCSSCIEMIQNSSELKEIITNIIVSDTSLIEDLNAFKTNNNFTEPFYMRGSDDSFATLLDLDYYPTSFLVDETGIIRQVYIGNISADIILESIHSSLDLS